MKNILLIILLVHLTNGTIRLMKNKKGKRLIKIVSLYRCPLSYFQDRLKLALPFSLPSCPSPAPGAISLTPITTVAVDGNSIFSPVGFCNAMSVIVPLVVSGCDATSTWYRHISPGVDSSLIVSIFCGCKIGCTSNQDFEWRFTLVITRKSLESYVHS